MLPPAYRLVPPPGSAIDPFDAVTADTKRKVGLIYLLLLLIVELIAFVIAPLSYAVFTFIVLINQRRTKKPNRFVHFHIMQSVLLGGINLLGWIVFVIFIVSVLTIGQSGSSSTLTVLPTFPLILSLFFFIFSIVKSVIDMIGAFRGKYSRLPLLGKYAEKYADRGRIARVT